MRGGVCREGTVVAVVAAAVMVAGIEVAVVNVDAAVELVPAAALISIVVGGRS